MSYRLQKPFNGTEKEDFIVAYNHAMGLSITEGTDTYEQGDLTLKGEFMFALLPNEMMADVEVEIDVPDYEMQEEEYGETVYDYETVEEEYEEQAIDSETDEPLYESAEEEYEEQMVDSETGELVYDGETGEPIMETKTREIRVPVMETKTREIRRPIMEEVEEVISVPDFDEETGEQIGEHEETITKTVHKSHIEVRTREVEVQVGSHKETVMVHKPVINPDYEQEEAAKREAEFHAAFFNTSLGYIRRLVTMADGSHKDFLSDLLPVISMGVSQGQQVNIIAYDEPDFTEEVVDWTQLQHVQVVTPQFIQECFMQLSNDFLPINPSEE